MLRPGVELIEIIRGEAHRSGPLEAQPADVLFDGIDVRLLFFGRVGVVKAQMTLTTQLLCQPEIQTDRLGVADMQKAVGLRGESASRFW